jgi:hypothetical protein
VRERLRVMVSSTVQDLGPERDAATDAIGSFRFQRCRSELLESRALPSKEVCEQMARDCDLMLLILGDRYGWVIPELGLSVTEREYQVAHSFNPRKILVFEKKPREREKPQEVFVKTLKDFTTGHFIAQPFETPQQLREQVVESMATWVSQLPQQDRYPIRMDIGRTGMHTWDFSTAPFPVTDFGALPVLSRSAAILWHVAASAGTFLVIFLGAWSLDPWTKLARSGVQHGALFDGWLVVGIIVCAAITCLVGWKQWRYYFDDKTHSGRKEGIFERSIRQASPLERTLDLVLCVMAGILTGCVLVPVVWFGALAAYSATVVVRSAVTLRRRAPVPRTVNAQAGSWLHGSLAIRHNSLTAGGVLRGWVVVHTVFTLVALGSFIVLFWISNFAGSLMLALATLALGVLCAVLHRGLSEWSYRVGEKAH